MLPSAQAACLGCLPARTSIEWGNRQLDGSAGREEDNTTMRAALYARVSTLNGQHPEMQLAELREHASRRNWEIVSEYIDEGVSGSKESRPELNRLMADARRRQFDIVLVWKVDRFGTVAEAPGQCLSRP